MSKCKGHSKCKGGKKSNLEEYEDTHSAKAFVLGCIDYRFVDNMITFLESGPLAMKYDLTCLPGGSLSYTQTIYPYWKQTIIDQIGLAIELHHIKQIVIFDHMDCGAYQLVYPNLEANSDSERTLHVGNMTKAINGLKKLFPNLIYSGYLLNFEGKPEKIF